jgi:hypothetical protein
MLVLDRSAAEHNSLMIFSEYSLHGFFVLSIHHQARGFDLFANNVTTIEWHSYEYQRIACECTQRYRNNLEVAIEQEVLAHDQQYKGPFWGL